MAKAHWHHSYMEHGSGAKLPIFGCQNTECNRRSVYVWQRTATDAEVAADAATEGPYGQVVRNMQGPHHVAVFACAEHALPADDMAKTHGATCPAPDQGCVCNDAEQHQSAPGG